VLQATSHVLIENAMPYQRKQAVDRSGRRRNDPPR